MFFGWLQQKEPQGAFQCSNLCVGVHHITSADGRKRHKRNQEKIRGSQRRLANVAFKVSNHRCNASLGLRSLSAGRQRREILRAIEGRHGRRTPGLLILDSRCLSRARHSPGRWALLQAPRVENDQSEYRDGVLRIPVATGTQARHHHIALVDGMPTLSLSCRRCCAGLR